MTTLQRLEWDALLPLQRFYAQAGLAAPRIEPTSGPAMEQPYRRLLVHSEDMTSVLEQFHADVVDLRVLESRPVNRVLARKVVLVRRSDEVPVELGAIQIALTYFEPEARRAIEAGRRPLGAILREFGIAFMSRPALFFSIASDELISGTLGLTRTHRLYGRCNVLYGGGGEPIAEVVEILPPADGGRDDGD